ncbi:MAG TPA: MBOAT family O-acyltransferase [Acidimicrobiales bacterium]|nr:MBOAT family O-acyltransferase [Acidimicrobiales bacterium]
MLFPTIDFAIFFAVAFTANWALHPYRRLWKLAMIAASYVFYSWWDWRFVVLLGAVTLVAHGGALIIDRAHQDRAHQDRARRWALAGSVATLLGLLAWFKYYGFLAVNLDNLSHSLGSGRLLPLLEVTLPVGISFFTFMAVSYLVDVYRRRIDPAPLVDVAVYLSFFPHLVAGPIVRGEELLPQIQRHRDPRRIDFSRAAWLIAAGLFKKVVVSSYVASAIVDPVFSAPRQHTALEILFAVYGYAVQIYADFSGYTDIAIGCALLLGFRFPDNFDAPYTARSLQDFWRRWHITLSRWLRDYLYIPLGGNTGSRWATARNVVITMVLGGLWHGAAWTFVAWGAIHGAGQVVGHERRRRRSEAGRAPLPDGRWRIIGQRVGTFHLVCLGWVFFRADSLRSAGVLLERLVMSWGRAPLVTPLVVMTIAGAVAAQYLPPKAIERAQFTFSRQRVLVQGAILGLTLLVVTTLGPQGVAPFIYYRF